MEPRKVSREWQVLSLLRKDPPTAVDIRSLVELSLLEGGVKELQRVIANLRRMGFEIKGWKDRGDKKVYAYQLVQEARAEDPFVYLSSLIGRKGNKVLPWTSYRVEISWYPGRRGEIISVAIYPARRRKAASIEHHNIDRGGVVGFGWDESKLGARPLIPVLAVRRSESEPFTTQEERMLVDHIRAHIVQDFVRQALAEEDKKQPSSVAKVL